MEIWQLVVICSALVGLVGIACLSYGILRTIHEELLSVSGQMGEIPKGKHRYDEWPLANSHRNSQGVRRKPRSGKEVGGEADIPAWPSSYVRPQGHQGVPAGFGRQVA